MTQQPVGLRTSVSPSDVRFCLSRSKLETSSLWKNGINHPDSGPSVSGLWAASILWAAENLADFLSTTYRNVTRTR